MRLLLLWQPPGRYGAIGIEQNMVTRFKEKPRGDG